MACGLPVASSATWSVPVRTPVAVGVKVTKMLQLAPTVSEDPHWLLVMAKSPGFDPPMENEAKETVAVPVLRSVATIWLLLAETFHGPKSIADCWVVMTLELAVPMPERPTKSVVVLALI